MSAVYAADEVAPAFVAYSSSAHGEQGDSGADGGQNGQCGSGAGGGGDGTNKAVDDDKKKEKTEKAKTVGMATLFLRCATWSEIGLMFLGTCFAVLCG